MSVDLEFVLTCIFTLVWIVMFVVFVICNIIQCTKKPRLCSNCKCTHHCKSERCENEIVFDSEFCGACKHTCHSGVKTGNKLKTGGTCKIKVERLKNNWVDVETQKSIIVGYETKVGMHREKKKVRKMRVVTKTKSVPVQASETKWVTVYGPQYSGGSDRRFETSYETVYQNQSYTENEYYDSEEDEWVYGSKEVPITDVVSETTQINKPFNTVVDCGCLKCTCSICLPNQTHTCLCSRCECNLCKYKSKTKWINLILPLILILTLPPVYIQFANLGSRILVDAQMDSIAEFLLLSVSGVLISIPFLCCITLSYNFFVILLPCIRPHLTQNNANQNNRSTISRNGYQSV